MGMGKGVTPDPIPNSVVEPVAQASRLWPLILRGRLHGKVGDAARFIFHSTTPASLTEAGVFLLTGILFSANQRKWESSMGKKCLSLV